MPNTQREKTELPVTIFKESASILLGFVFSVLFMWIYGYLVVSITNEYSIEKSQFIESLGGLSLPSSESIKDLDFSFLFECGIFFALTLGVPSGLIIPLIILASNKRYNYRKIYLFNYLILIGIVLFIKIGLTFHTFLSLITFVTFPFFIYFGYQIPKWVFNCFKNFEAKLKQGDFSYKYPLILSIVLFVGIFFSLLVFVKSSNLNYLKIRDNILLKNNIGRYLNDYYYKHSPFATEAIKPITAKRLITGIYIGSDEKTLKSLKSINRSFRYYFSSSESLTGAKILFKNKGIDILIIDNNDVSEEKLRKSMNSEYKKSIILLTGYNKQNNGQNRIVKPLNIKKLNIAVQKLSASFDHSKGLRWFIKHSIFDLVLVFTFLFVILISVFFISSNLILIKILFLSKKQKSFLSLYILTLFVVMFIGFKAFTRLKSVSSYKKKIVEFKNQQNIQGLIKLSSSADDEERYQSVFFLSRISEYKIDKGMKNIFLKSLKDSDPRVRMYSASGLGNIKAMDSVHFLIELFNDPLLNVRYKALEALGNIGDKKSLLDIQKLIEESKIWYVSDYAYVAFKKIYFNNKDSKRRRYRK